ncbi:hypothetical protein H1R20_g14476, partial [Candolleomyces eurysporus]
MRTLTDDSWWEDIVGVASGDECDELQGSYGLLEAVEFEYGILVDEFDVE